MGYDLDFRSRDEADAAPDPELGRMERTFVPIDLNQYLYPKDAGEVDDNCYVSMLKDEDVLNMYAKFFRIIVDNRGDQPVLWHGTEGEDRTGLVAALLLNVLNVSQDTIMEDYELSGAFTGNAVNRIKLEKAFC